MVIARLFTFALLLGSLLGVPTPVILASVPPMQVAQSVWRRHVSQAGGFSILFPGTPQTLQRTVPITDAIAETVTMLYVFREQESSMYAVAYNDFNFIEEETVSPDVIEASLNSGRDGMLKSNRATLLSERKISLGDYPGREIRFRQADGWVGKARFYFVNKRLYQVLTLVDSKVERNLTKSIDGFLASFQLLTESEQ
ncbi:MAG TPA: hypothetical protein IGS53_24260 [Leptolyngbyaceae cyanobacterium M33_DOE_097]|uniref:DUF1795 domain-containing protein n=1 Tax=Oscillatoriales cyanobacterium SpSt-418 TaxID=2282169 RepID=A0A7C3PHS1_9CYAN|nr:hypothetical protein [Leptolyngbyaceae cyanobacterium M33_DOE_097]